MTLAQEIQKTSQIIALAEKNEQWDVADEFRYRLNQLQKAQSRRPSTLSPWERDRISEVLETL